MTNVYFVVKVMANCWDENPEARPSFNTLRQDLHNFDAIYERKYADYQLPVYRSETTKRTKEDIKGKVARSREAAIAARKTKV